MALHEHLAPFLGRQETALTETLLRLRGWALWCLNRPRRQLRPGHRLRPGPGRRPRAGPRRHPPRHPGLPQQPRLAYQAAGRLAEAIPLYERTLTDREQAPRRHPPRHPDLPQQPRRRLPGGRAAGRGHPAVRAHPRRPRAAPGRHPPRHPDLPQQPRLAYQAAGRLAEAIPLYERTLADREQLLGDTHPDTLTSRNNLAPPTRRPGGWPRPSRCTSAPSPTASSSWATPTPTP